MCSKKYIGQQLFKMHALLLRSLYLLVCSAIRSSDCVQRREQRNFIPDSVFSGQLSASRIINAMLGLARDELTEIIQTLL
jgi:hypothetical protein